MKYQTFNRSCAYAALANLLEHYHINKEDHDIICEAEIPYFINFDKEQKRYQAGPMLQGKKWFDLFLLKYGLEFFEKELDPVEILPFLEKIDFPCMLGLKLGSAGKHAVVFHSYQNEQYTFLNIKHEGSNEESTFLCSRQKLEEMIPEKQKVGWLQQCPVSVQKDFSSIFESSLAVLRRFEADVVKNIEKEMSKQEATQARENLFEALFLDIPSMLELIGESELHRRLVALRGRYLESYNINMTSLKDQIRKEEIRGILQNYKGIITKRNQHIPH